MSGALGLVRRLKTYFEISGKKNFGKLFTALALRAPILFNQATQFWERHMMNEKELEKFIAGLPEHLRFFFVQPPEGMDAEEFLKFSREQVAMTRLYRDELIAHGVKADDFLANIVPKFQAAEQACLDVDKSENDLLTARANLADAEYNLFKLMKQGVESMEEEKPFDPAVQEWREQLDELAKNFPKE